MTIFCRDKINLAVLVLIEDGTLHKLKTKWWKDKGECSDAEVIYQKNSHVHLDIIIV